MAQGGSIRYINVYTLTFFDKDGKFVTDNVHAHQLWKAREIAEKRYPGVRFTSFYPNGNTPLTKENRNG